jgi:hypothetical protein
MFRMKCIAFAIGARHTDNPAIAAFLLPLTRVSESLGGSWPSNLSNEPYTDNFTDKALHFQSRIPELSRLNVSFDATTFWLLIKGASGPVNFIRRRGAGHSLI